MTQGLRTSNDLSWTWNLDTPCDSLHRLRSRWRRKLSVWPRIALSMESVGRYDLHDTRRFALPMLPSLASSQDGAQSWRCSRPRYSPLSSGPLPDSLGKSCTTLMASHEAQCAGLRGARPASLGVEGSDRGRCQARRAASRGPNSSRR